MSQALVAVGSNLGDRAATLDAAVAAIAAAADVSSLQRSSWQLTLPAGGRSDRREFLNGAVLLETSRTPQKLLQLLQEIESQLGRERHERWGDRTLDLDLVLCGDAVIDTPNLTVPHPRMSFRRFVLEPAVEIAGAMVHPTIGWTLERLVDHLDTGSDALAMVSTDEAVRDALLADLLCRYELEPSGPPIQDKKRWPPGATRWLRLPGTRETAVEPKLSIVIGKEASPISGRGPTLCVPAADGQDIATDIFAAVEAVWPPLGPSRGMSLQ